MRSPHADMKCEPYRNLSASLCVDSFPIQQETNTDGTTNTSPNKSIGKPAVVSWYGWLLLLWLVPVVFVSGMSWSRAGGQTLISPEKHSPPEATKHNERSELKPKTKYWMRLERGLGDQSSLFLSRSIVFATRISGKRPFYPMLAWMGTGRQWFWLPPLRWCCLDVCHIIIIYYYIVIYYSIIGHTTTDNIST